MEDSSGEPTRAILVALTKELGEFVISKYRHVHKREFRNALENDINQLHGSKKYRFKSKKHIFEKVDFSEWSKFIENIAPRNVELSPAIRTQIRKDLGELRNMRNFWAHPTAIPFTSREYRDIVRLSKSVLKAIGSKAEIDKIVAANSERLGVPLEEFEAVKNATMQILLDTAQMEENMAQMRSDLETKVLATVRAELHISEEGESNSVTTDPIDSAREPPQFWLIKPTGPISRPDAAKGPHAGLGADFAFSAKSLGDYADCARRFELRYIKRLRYPALEVEQALEYERRTRQGARFHKLVQQHVLGVPADLLALSLADDEELARWWRNYLALGIADLPPIRHAEITLGTGLDGQRLVAKYDLLALAADEAAVIVDWKTGGRVPARSQLARRMQTVIYRYVLAQAGTHLYGAPIPPERIRMDYVYVAAGGERVSLAYDAAQLAADEALLRNMIGEIGAADVFALTANERRCKFCNYRSLCDRGGAGRLDELEFDDEETDEEEFDLDFDQIAEIEF